MTLLLDAGMTELLMGLLLGLIGLIIVCWIAAEIFGARHMLKALKIENKHSLIQVRLLKRLLIQQGVSPEEVDSIIENGNK